MAERQWSVSEFLAFQAILYKPAAHDSQRRELVT